jgi:hypothetical protein
MMAAGGARRRRHARGHPAAALEWARHARAWRAFVYFTGPALIQSLPVVAAARKLSTTPARSLFVQERKGPGVRDYIMLKRRNAEPPVLSRAAHRGARAGHQGR